MDGHGDENVYSRVGIFKNNEIKLINECKSTQRFLKFGVKNLSQIKYKVFICIIL